MNRRRIALMLGALVGLSGVLPIALFAAAALQVLRTSSEDASRQALRAIAEQAAARIAAYIGQERQSLRALGMALGTEPDASRRLADVTLDAPSLANLRLVAPDTPAAELPQKLTPAQIHDALAGQEVASPTYIDELSPAMDVCVPSGRPLRTVCATLDLLELQRQVQRIRVGSSGYALAFDRSGRVLAAGAGPLRAAVLSGERIAESTPAEALARGQRAPQRLRGDDGVDQLAGWAFEPQLGWTIAVEQPADEALRGARTALLVLGAGALLTLLLSVALGAVLARRMLSGLEKGERWRTAGRIAAGITHDLGHRLAILKQTKALAETDDAAYLPRIRESLAGEVDTLQRFVTDFADLTREPSSADFLPVELNALASSVRRSAEHYAAQAGVDLSVVPAAGELWIMGDRYMLERAALNLLRNAVEASPPGARVVLRVSREHRSAALLVEDQGPGIAADRLPTLFDSFSSTKRTGAHVGMGLPNVRRIATAHGGEVFVQSAEGRGSTFTLSLPIAELSGR